MPAEMARRNTPAANTDSRILYRMDESMERRASRAVATKKAVRPSGTRSDAGLTTLLNRPNSGASEPMELTMKNVMASPTSVRRGTAAAMIALRPGLRAALATASVTALPGPAPPLASAQSPPAPLAVQPLSMASSASAAPRPPPPAPTQSPSASSAAFAAFACRARGAAGSMMNAAMGRSDTRMPAVAAGRENATQQMTEATLMAHPARTMTARGLRRAYASNHAMSRMMAKNPESASPAMRHVPFDARSG